MFAYGVAAHIVDEYLRMTESRCVKPMYMFCKYLVVVLGLPFLKEPNVADRSRLMAIENGFFPLNTNMHQLHALK